MNTNREKKVLPAENQMASEEFYSWPSKKLLLPRNTDDTILPVELMVPSLSELDSESLLPE